MNFKSKTENQLNSRSKSETHENVVSQEKTNYLAKKNSKNLGKEEGELERNVLQQNKTHTIDTGSNDIVSGYLKLIDGEVQKIDQGKLNEVHQNEKMIYEVNKNGNDTKVNR